MSKRCESKALTRNVLVDASMLLDGLLNDARNAIRAGDELVRISSVRPRLNLRKVALWILNNKIVH
jgi:hypothetical protein